MYIVRNLGHNTIVISDLRAEIGPFKVIDLEKIARREDIDRSHNLQECLHSKKLQLVKSSVVPVKTTTETVERVVERVVIQDHTNEQLIKNIRQVIAEELPKHTKKGEHTTTTVTPDMSEINHKLEQMMSDLREQISSFVPAGQESTQPSISPEKIAEISEKPINKITQDFQTSTPPKQNKFVIKGNDKLHERAQELD